jgi:hypothetical protein
VTAAPAWLRGRSPSVRSRFAGRTSSTVARISNSSVAAAAGIVSTALGRDPAGL